MVKEKGVGELLSVSTRAVCFRCSQPHLGNKYGMEMYCKGDLYSHNIRLPCFSLRRFLLLLSF